MPNFNMPSQEELDFIGDLIFFNETSRNEKFLVWWNDGENFASLGIGHAIWFREGQDPGYEEGLPLLVAFYRQKNIKLPRILEENKHCPWQSKAEQDAARSSEDFINLTQFFIDTKDIQTEFMLQRCLASLEKIKAISESPLHIEKQFQRMANSEGGFYPLIDYVNFKGEGIKDTETKRGLGWGLKQVLEGMKGEETGPSALTDFSVNASFMLSRLIVNSCSEGSEKCSTLNRWHKGWLRRCLSYRVAMLEFDKK